MSKIKKNTIKITNRILQALGYQLTRYTDKPARKKPEKYEYQERSIVFSINSSDKVLDIGSGGQPFPLATHLCDLRLETNSDRPTESIVIDERPFFISDINDLPVSSKFFDFVYCCHVLEHVADPIISCKELQRAGKRGYIETPTLGKDILFGWARGLHRWYIVNHGKTLIFFEYTDRLLDGCKSTYWKNKILSSNYHPLQDLYYDNQDIFNVMFLWEDKFRVEVFRINQARPEVYDPF